MEIENLKLFRLPGEVPHRWKDGDEDCAVNETHGFSSSSASFSPLF